MTESMSISQLDLLKYAREKIVADLAEVDVRIAELESPPARKAPEVEMASIAPKKVKRKTFWTQAMRDAARDRMVKRHASKKRAKR